MPPPTPIGTPAELALVKRIVARYDRYLPNHVRREDIEQAGLIGLWDAHRLMPEGIEDGHRKAYTAVKIKGAIKDELRRQDWFPRGQRAEDIDKQLRMIYADDWLDLFPAKYRSQELEICAKRISLAALSILDGDELYAVRESFIKERTQLSVSVSLGLTEPRVSQIIKSGLAKVRALLEQDI